FIGMEIHEFHHLISLGFGPQRSGFLSGFFALVGTHGLHVASGCVINNVIDRDIDGLMARTRNRPMVTGCVPVPFALLYGV
ncbi:UbiA family prenyltransferase, partial [Paraburkholderia sp. BR14319]|uniref:UbiA family prenyltransferase n=1 Tax=Paraburkholderia sp. BR14319 TaxID=3237005 RepID=UPI0034D1BED4